MYCSHAQVLMRVAVIAVGFVTGCASNPGSDYFQPVKITSRTVEGCRFVQVGHTSRMPKFAAEYEENERRNSYSWQGNCADGFINGPGRLIVSTDGVVGGEYWQIGKSQTIARFRFLYAKSGEIYYYDKNEDQVSPVYLTPSECLAIKDCKTLHDSRIEFLGAAKVAAEDDLAEKSARTERERVARFETERKANEERSRRNIEYVEQKVARENRELKQQILAERRQAERVDSSANTLALVGALIQGVAATRSRNAAQQQPLSVAMQTIPQPPAQMKSNSSDFSSSTQNSANTASSKAATTNTGLYGNEIASNQNDPFVYSSSVNECLIVENHPTLVGTKGLRNRCGFKITYTFCEYRKGSNGATNDQCQKRVFGTDSLNPGGSTYLIADTQRIYYIACKDPYYATGSKLTWDGSALRGRCQMAR